MRLCVLLTRATTKINIFSHILILKLCTPDVSANCGSVPVNVNNCMTFEWAYTMFRERNKSLQRAHAVFTQDGMIDNCLHDENVTVDWIALYVNADSAFDISHKQIFDAPVRF
jgi:hypothetical protein